MRKLAPLLICLLAGVPAIAQDIGWFLTAQLGIADYDTLQTRSGDPAGNTDDSAFAWAIGGGYDFSRNFAVRAMFERSSGHTSTAFSSCPPDTVCIAQALPREQLDFNNLSLVAVPRLPLGPRASVYGTIGLQYWDSDGGPVMPGDDGFEFLFGGGLDYMLNPRFSIGGEVQASPADYLAGRFTLRYSF